jgi:hypothetical protein
MVTQQCCVVAAVGFGKVTPICVLTTTNWGGGVENLLPLRLCSLKTNFTDLPRAFEIEMILFFLLVRIFLFLQNASGVR